MSTPTTEEYRTRAAEWVDTIILHEEELHPLPENPSPGMLVARVEERLQQAAFALRKCQGDHIEVADEQWNESDSDGMLRIGVYFVGAAAFAITAISRLHPDVVDSPAITVKDSLLAELDDDVADWIDEHQDLYESASCDLWLKLVLSNLIGASQGVCELEGMKPLVPLDAQDEDDGDYESVDELEEEDEDSYDDREALHAQVADSLLETAATAAAAGQWFIEFHEQLAQLD